VPDTKCFELSEQAAQLLVADMIDARAAIARHQFQLLRIEPQDARHEVAAPLFEIPQHADFVLEPLARMGSPELLIDGPVVSDANQSAGGVFGVVHE
jgi:hypothetical protein